MIVATILAVLLVIISYNLKNRLPFRPEVPALVRSFGIGIFIVALLFNSVKQIEPGYVGVTSLFGKVSNNILTSGLHFVNPLVEVTNFNIKTQNYTMSGVNDEGTKQGDDAIRALTADGLEVIIDLTVLYSAIPNQCPRILKEIGINYQDLVIRPLARTKIRDNAVYYEAVALYSARRDEFQSKIYKAIEEVFNKRGLQLEQLLIRNITLPSSVKLTIESKINAEQEAQKMEFVLQKEKQEAERKRVEAKGIADYQQIINQSLTDKQLQYEQLKVYKELANSQNAKFIIMGNKGASPSILMSDK